MVRIQDFSKIQNGWQKPRSGQHSLARQKNTISSLYLSWPAFRINFQDPMWLSQHAAFRVKAAIRKLMHLVTLSFRFLFRHLKATWYTSINLTQQISATIPCWVVLLSFSLLSGANPRHTPVTPHTPRFVSRHLHASAEHFPHSPEWTFFTENILAGEIKKR